MGILLTGWRALGKSRRCLRSAGPAGLPSLRPVSRLSERVRASSEGASQPGTTSHHTSHSAGPGRLRGGSLGPGVETPKGRQALLVLQGLGAALLVITAFSVWPQLFLRSFWGLTQGCSPVTTLGVLPGSPSTAVGYGSLPHFSPEPSQSPALVFSLPTNPGKLHVSGDARKPPTSRVPSGDRPHVIFFFK